MRHILEAANSGVPWKADISTSYFLREADKSMVWAWRVIFQHSDVSTQVQSIVAAIQSAPRARFEVVEQPLPGVTGWRSTMNAKNKGAAPVGSANLLIHQRAGTVR